MLPTDLLLNMGSTHGLAMVFSMLLAAIIWNLGTWFFGLPASSSHTLIGAIIGIGLTNALLTGSSVMDALNLREVTKIFSSLIVSPIVGLVIAGLIFLLRRFWSGTKSVTVFIVFLKIAKEKKANVSRHSGRVLPSLFPLRAWRFHMARMTGRKELVW